MPSYRIAAALSSIIGNFTRACEWAEKALELTKVCTGTDYVSYSQDEENLRMLMEAKRKEDAIAAGRKTFPKAMI